MRESIVAGCDSIELNTDIDDESVRMVVEKGTFMTFGLTTNTRAGKSQNFPMGEMLKASFQRALKAGVKIAFAVNANGAHGKQEGPYHGEEAVEFRLMTQYGMPPASAPFCNLGGRRKHRLGRPSRGHRERQVCGHHWSFR